MPKNAQTTAPLHSSHASKVMVKILQARLQQYMNHELPDVLAVLWNQKSNCQHLLDHGKSKRGPKKKQNIQFCFIDCAKTFDCVDHNKLENSERDGNTRPPDLPPEKPVCRSGSNS